MADEPAALGGPAPVEPEAGGDSAEFDANMTAFLNHNFDEADPFAAIAEDGAAAPAPAVPSVAAPSAASSLAAAPVQVNAAPAATSIASAVAAPVATEGEQAAPAAVDPNLIAQMMGLAATPSAPATASVAAPAASTAAPAPTDAPFAPIPSNFALPQELTTAIFESEDPRTREKALSELMASYGNAILQIADQRMAAHHAPRFMAQANEARVAESQAAAIYSDFYGAFADLKPYTQVVLRAMEVVRGSSPAGTQYSPEVRDKIGNLARQAITQMGVSLAAPAAVPAAPAVTPQAERRPGPAGLFEAGGARPGQANGADNDPGALFDSMNF